MAPLILYHFPPSGPSRVALVAIRNLNLDVEIREINLWKKEQLKEEYVRINPQHCVPTIDDHGFILWESRAIVIYLVEKTHPNGHLLYPKNVQQRALINQRLQFDCGTLYPRVRAICWPVLFAGETKISDENRQKLNEALEWLNTFLNGHKYVCGGDNPTLADLSIWVTVANIVHIGADLSKYKNIAEWYDRCNTLPGYEENIAGAKLFGDRVTSLLQDEL